MPPTRRPPGHDFPGADDRAQPGDEDRRPGRRAARASTAACARRAAHAAALAALERVRLPDARREDARLPAPAFGRPASARDDRHGDGVFPEVLIADEPTTALDVTVQAQILALLVVAGRRAAASSLLLITHDLPVVATVCQRVLVLYGGHIVEQGTVDDVFGSAPPSRTRARCSTRSRRSTTSSRAASSKRSPAPCPASANSRPAARSAIAARAPTASARPCRHSTRQATCTEPRAGTRSSRDRRRRRCSASITSARRYALPRTSLFGPRRCSPPSTTSASSCAARKRSASSANPARARPR